MRQKTILLSMILTLVCLPLARINAESNLDNVESSQNLSRFSLSSVEHSDFEALKEIFQNPAAVNMSGDYLDDATTLMVISAASSPSDLRANWQLFMSGIRDSAGNLIGVMQFYEPTPEGSATLGFAIKQSHWGQGIATEAGKEFIRYGFEQLGLRHIKATTLQSNQGANRVLEKIGFEKVGERPFKAGVMDNVYSLQIAPSR